MSLFRTVLVLLCLCVFSNAANLVFDLNNQYYVNTLPDNSLTIDKSSKYSSTKIRKNQNYGKFGKYELKKAIVATNTELYDKGYTLGTMAVTLKKDIKNFSVSFGFQRASQPDGPTVLQITSSRGVSETISIGSRKIIFAGQYMQAKDGKGNAEQFFNINFDKQGSTILYKVNGDVIYTTNADEFGNLKKAQITLMKGSFGDNDFLTTLDIYEK